MGDFGLTGKSGGTSIFMAPEGLDKDSRIIGKSDLFSFAVTVLFLMFRVDLAMQLLFLPISQDLEYFRESLHQLKLLEIIFESVRWNAEKRVTIQSWSIVSDIIKDFEGLMLTGKISSKNLERKGVALDPLNKALINEGEFELDSSEVNTKAWKIPKAVSHMQKLSSIYCDKKFSLLSKSMILIYIFQIISL